MKYKCEKCHDTGYYGDLGVGIKGNNEYIPCECRQAVKPTALDQWKAFLTEQGIEWKEFKTTEDYENFGHKKGLFWLHFIIDENITDIYFNPDGSLYKGKEEK